MKEWKLCDFCEEEAVNLYYVELLTQHCYPTFQCQRYICDRCLRNRGIDPDALARAVLPRDFENLRPRHL